MYTIEKDGKRALWVGSLHDCLYNIAHQITSHALWKTVTFADAYSLGYRIVKA